MSRDLDKVGLLLLFVIFLWLLNFLGVLDPVIAYANTYLNMYISWLQSLVS